MDEIFISLNEIFAYVYEKIVFTGPNPKTAVRSIEHLTVINDDE